MAKLGASFNLWQGTRCASSQAAATGLSRLSSGMIYRHRVRVCSVRSRGRVVLAILEVVVSRLDALINSAGAG
ncbi:MAG: hypothetical protein ACI9S9_004873 [Planctomycetota bacterium]|jgi:hypothetical protein